jgi:DNA-binding transcriptional MerR regulator
VKSGSYSTVEAARMSGLSYRQLDEWDRRGFVKPSLAQARGSGVLPYRRYSGEDVDKLLLISKLLQAGVSLARIRSDGDPQKTADAVVRSLEPLTRVSA